MCCFHLNLPNPTYNSDYIRHKLTRSYWRFVYDRLSRRKRRRYQRYLIYGYCDDEYLNLDDVSNLLERSRIAKINFLYWKKIAKKEGIYYQTLRKYENNKPNPLYHDKAFFRKLPGFLGTK